MGELKDKAKGLTHETIGNTKQAMAQEGSQLDQEGKSARSARAKPSAPRARSRASSATISDRPPNLTFAKGRPRRACLLFCTAPCPNLRQAVANMVNALLGFRRAA